MSDGTDNTFAAVKTYAQYLAERFVGKVQKISINTSCVCPNRDGTLGSGGCAYCNNSSFTPAYCAGINVAPTEQSVVEQLSVGMRFFARKYPQMTYLAYFQSNTPTHNRPDSVKRLVDAALSVPGVVGVVMGTRPDCMPDGLLQHLGRINKDVPVLMEYGAETSHNITLQRINRCHTWQCVTDTVQRTADAGLSVGLHFIAGLPGEDNSMVMETVHRLNELPVDVVKFHQLQVIRGTALARQWQDNPQLVPVYTVDEYIALCLDILDILRRDIAVDRFVASAPDALLLAPRWGLKNYEFMARLMRARQSRRN